MPTGNLQNIFIISESADSASSHFLIPPIFTPSSSPSKETFELPNNSSSSNYTSRKPKKLAFNFVTNTNEVAKLAKNFLAFISNKRLSNFRSLSWKQHWIFMSNIGKIQKAKVWIQWIILVKKFIISTVMIRIYK